MLPSIFHNDYNTTNNTIEQEKIHAVNNIIMTNF